MLSSWTFEVYNIAFRPFPMLFTSTRMSQLLIQINSQTLNLSGM